MRAEPVNIVWDYLNPACIFGPIFDKELRVSSRRTRNYFLRSIYVVLLTLFILFMWLTVIPANNVRPATFQISRSAAFGRQITIAIIWFQFIVSNILAIVMLSSSISDEIRTGTLNVLMTTPINSFQIVIGKFFSKLLQVFLLLAVSLPLLAIIRGFGGIQWSYIVFSLYITLCTVIFAGSFSLFLSVFYRQAYRVIVYEIVLFIVLYGTIPVLLLLSANLGLFKTNTIHTILSILNPYWLLFAATQRMSPSSMLAPFQLVNCLILLFLSAVFLGISILKVRSIALNGVSFKNKNKESKDLITDEKSRNGAHYYLYSDHIRQVYGTPIEWKEKFRSKDSSANIRRVYGNPIAWKEKYFGMFGKSVLGKVIAVLIYLFCMIVVSYLIFSLSFGSILVSLAMSAIYLITMIRLAVFSAGSISSEKEARTLPILLVTPLREKDIILGKVFAAVRKNMSLLILYMFMLFILYCSYRLRGILKISQFIYQVPISLVGIVCSVLFIVGCGCYFGVRMKNTVSAIAATIGTYLVLYFLIIVFNPVRLILMLGLMRTASAPSLIVFISLFSSLVSVLMHGGIGLFFLRKSIKTLRSNIF